MSGNILVVDDEKIVRDFFLDVAQSLGGSIDTAEDGDVAVEKCRSRHYDIVFVDMRMPHMNGLDTCKCILNMDPTVKVVMMSGYSEDRLMDEAISCGAMAKISKPFDLKMILTLIENAVRTLSGGRGGAGGPAHYAFARN
jgi:two-component system response regulator (stage 0 sporulation protein F)